MTELKQSVSAKQVRDVITLGKKYSKTAFPNPSREGCPKPSTLRAMAHRDRRLALKDLPVSHVVNCSPCFQEYSRLRRRCVLVRGIQGTAGSLIVLAILFAAVRFAWNYTRRNGEPNISHQHRAQPEPRVAARQASPAVAPLAMTVDLAFFSPTRGEEARGLTKKIHLPPKSLRVTFVMPMGMEPGEYALLLKDSAGTVLKDTDAPGRMNDGITSVDVDLDFTSARRGQFSLMIRPPGLSWRTFPVLVE